MQWELDGPVSPSTLLRAAPQRERRFVEEVDEVVDLLSLHLDYKLFLLAADFFFFLQLRNTGQVEGGRFCLSLSVVPQEFLD